MAWRDKMSEIDQKLELARPNRALVRMLFALVAVAIGISVFFSTLLNIWEANLALNSLIILGLISGIAYCFVKVFELRIAVNWLTSYAHSQDEATLAAAPNILVPMARLIRYDHQGKPLLFPHLANGILDSVEGRLAEIRDISGYMRNLLVFLGLLGTFWGLILTIQGVLQAIDGLDLANQELVDAFTTMKDNLQKPMQGMATAFGTSLTGLGGSLILGFFDLQLGRAQNNFYNHMEEWLSGQVRMESQSLGVSGGSSAYLEALVEQTAEGLNQTRRLLLQMREDRHNVEQNLAVLAEDIRALASHIDDVGRGSAQNAIQSQEMRHTLDKLISTLNSRQEEEDASTAILRSIDRRLAKAGDNPREDLSQLTETITEELRLLTKTMASIFKGYT